MKRRKEAKIKYEYDEELDVMKLDFVFGGLSYSFNYGFIPEARAEDGDHLDVIVLSSQLLALGTVVQARPIGLIEIIDRSEEDHKIIAVPLFDAQYADWQSIKDVPAAQIKKFEEFFPEVARQKNKKMEVKGFFDKDRAILELNKCRERYLKK